MKLTPPRLSADVWAQFARFFHDPNGPNPLLIRQPTADALDDAATALRAGQLVAFPTETVYGLGADATNGEAVARIYAAKGRPRFNPLIVHIGDPEDAARLGVLEPALLQVLDTLWPGPLTVVVDTAESSPVASLATAGLSTVALRCPSHPVARALIRRAGCPLVAPSANRSGHVSATTAQHIANDLGASAGTTLAMILDGGPSEIGLESTILDASVDGTWTILRDGAIGADDIARACARSGLRCPEITTRPPVARSAEDRPSAPGQLESHYAPRAKVVLNRRDIKTADALLAFGPPPSQVPPGVRVLNLSATGSLTEAAANLFAHLRTLDEAGVATIGVMPIPESGLGAAINDRLRRAAAPR